MKSPFPGMDPYLESRWGDVHSSLIIYARDLLNRSLPPGLLARSEVRAIVSAVECDWRDFFSDVSIIERGLAEPSTLGTDSVALADSLCLVLEASTEIKQRYLEIRDSRSGDRVISVIEFVSPANKRPGPGLDKYREKQQECFDGDVNLIEIDLTRVGDRTLIMPIKRLSPLQTSTYMAIVRRALDRQHAWLYRLPLQQRLGGIPIPLRPTDRDIVLDLQSLVDRIYENGRYEFDLTYTEALHPSLSREDATWAAGMINAWK